MKTIRLDLDYPARVLSNGEAPAQVSLNLITYAVNSKERAPVKDLRIWDGLLLKLMNDSGEPIPGPIDIEDAPFEFLRKALDEAQYPPQIGGAALYLIDSLK